MELAKAKTICAEVAAEAKRWGKHAGFASYHVNQVQEALIAIYEAGLFDNVGEREERIAANKNAGAAKARASRAQQMLEEEREVNQQLKAKILLLEKRLGA